MPHTYTPIPDSDLLPGSPAKSETAILFRDNPLAIVAGADGAPHVVPNRFITLTPDDNGDSPWVVPAGVYRLKFTMLGGSGGGAGGPSVGPPDAGGRGSVSATLIAVVQVEPGWEFSYSVGAGGDGGAVNNPGSDGGDSSIVLSDPEPDPAFTLTAIGGGGGAANGDPGVAGFTTQSALSHPLYRGSYFIDPQANAGSVIWGAQYNPGFGGFEGDPGQAGSAGFIRIEY